MEAIYHSGSGGRETGVIFLHGFQINEVDRKWMATFGSERPMTARQWGHIPRDLGLPPQATVLCRGWEAAWAEEGTRVSVRWRGPVLLIV